MALRTYVLLPGLVYFALASLAAGVPLNARRQLKWRRQKWRIFLDALQESAQSTIRNNPLGQSHDTVARAVVYGLNSMVDPYTGMQGNHFRAEFSAFVWGSSIPASHQHAVQRGAISQDNELLRFGYDSASDGIMPYLACEGDKVISRKRRAGKFGWPCLWGGSVGFTDALAGRSCMVFMRALDTSRQTDQPGFSIVHRAFCSAIEQCKQPPAQGSQARHRIYNLTNLAKCIMLSFQQPVGSTEQATLKGLAVLPAHSETAVKDGQPQLYGVASSYGHLLQEAIEVPESLELPDLNTHPLILLCVAAFS